MFISFEQMEKQTIGVKMKNIIIGNIFVILGVTFIGTGCYNFAISVPIHGAIQLACGILVLINGISIRQA